MAVGRALRLNMMNIGSGRVTGQYPGIALPAHPAIPHPGYTPLPDYWHVHGCTVMSTDLNMAVGSNPSPNSL